MAKITIDIPIKNLGVCVPGCDYFKQLKEAKEIIRNLLSHLTKDTFSVMYETEKETIARAENFLKELPNE